MLHPCGRDQMKDGPHPFPYWHKQCVLLRLASASFRKGSLILMLFWHTHKLEIDCSRSALNVYDDASYMIYEPSTMAV